MFRPAQMGKQNNKIKKTNLGKSYNYIKSTGGKAAVTIILKGETNTIKIHYVQ